MKKKIGLPMQILIALILGIVVGLVCGMTGMAAFTTAYLKPFGTIFVNLLKFIVVPVVLWCVGNWCLTTLFDGEGSFKDIFIATGYSLAPLPLFVTVSTILSNVVTTSEGSMVSLLVTIGYIWVALLLFFGMMVTHDYSMGKNFITVLGTIVAMAIIMFVAILFSSLVVKMITFVVSIFTEIGNRV